jgi:TPR repeat protein
VNGHQWVNDGFRHWTGEGMPQNDVEAVRIWRQGADAGHAVCWDPLGHAYWEGRGVSQSYAQAVECWKNAGDEGLLGLADAYWWGYGVSQDRRRAVEYLRRQLKNQPENRHAAAVAHARLAFALETGDGADKDFDAARHHYRLAQKLGASEKNNIDAALKRLRKPTWLSRLFRGPQPGPNPLAEVVNQQPHGASADDGTI